MASQTYNKKVKNYSLDSTNILGSGSFGIVYKGIHPEHKGFIAAKQVNVDRDEEFVEAALREADILQKVNHENILNIYDVFKLQSVSKPSEIEIWMITEYCNLRNLKDYMYNYERRITDQIKIKLIQQCTSALLYLHTLQPEAIIHRDIKPVNVLIKGTVYQPIVKIGDFGLAKYLDRIEGVTVKTGTFAGTFDYMAPEVFANRETTLDLYSTKADIFSMGLLFYAILNGIKNGILKTISVNGNSLCEKMIQQENFSPDMSSLGTSDFSQRFQALIGKMLKGTEDKRCAITEVAKDVDEIAQVYLYKIICMGGRPENWSDANTAVLVLESLEWKKITDLPQKCTETWWYVCQVPDGFVVIFDDSREGGHSNPKVACQHYSIRENKWRALPDRRTVRAGTSAACVEDKMFVFAGEDPEGTQLTVTEFLCMPPNWELDKSKRPWETCHEMPKGMQRKPFAVTVNDSIYLLDRYDKHDLLCFEHLKNHFTKKTALPESNNIKYCSATSCGTEIFVVGGQDDVFLKYDTKNDNWTSIKVSSKENFYGRAVSFGSNKVLLFGCTDDGNETTGAQDVIEEYDVREKRIRTLAYKCYREGGWPYSPLSVIITDVPIPAVHA